VSCGWFHTVFGYCLVVNTIAIDCVERLISKTVYQMGLLINSLPSFCYAVYSTGKYFFLLI